MPRRGYYRNKKKEGRKEGGKKGLREGKTVRKRMYVSGLRNKNLIAEDKFLKMPQRELLKSPRKRTNK